MRKVLNLSFALALVAGLFAGSLATAGAVSPVYGPQNANSTIYFPFVHNNTTVDGMPDAFTGAVVIQNLEVFPINVAITTSKGTTSAALNPRAAKTFSASAIGVPDGGGWVKAVGSYSSSTVAKMLSLNVCKVNTVTTSQTVNSSGGTVDQFTPSAPVYSVNGVPQIKSIKSTDGVNTFTGYTASFAANGDIIIDWTNSNNAPTGQYVVTYYTTNCGSPAIGGVEKHAAPGGGSVITDSTMDTVDGSSAVPGCDLAYASFQAVGSCTAPDWSGASLPELMLDQQFRWIQPIVQTNSGWDTVLHLSNVSGIANVGVNVYYYAGGGQGVAGQSQVIWSGTMASGATQSIDLGNQLDAESVGSLWIDADAAVVASVDRVKPATGMALTNVAQPRLDNVLNYLQIFGINATTKYAPLIFRDYNNWNTGINIANLSSNTNQVTINYYNYSDNSMSQETINIPPRAMEYVYRPGAGSDAGLMVGNISAATISGTDPIAVAVDEVKYSGTTMDAGQAMSYLATEGAMAGNAYDTGQFPALANLGGVGRFVFSNDLSLPLVQKGSNSSGMGDFSGINLFNADPNNGVDAWVIFEDNAGLPVAPTVGANEREMPFKLSLPALGSAIVYTANYSEMPTGFVGSAVVGSMYTKYSQTVSHPLVGPLTAVSNNVNYAVGMDGSSVFNLYPYTHLLPQVAAGCYYPGFVGTGTCIP